MINRKSSPFLPRDGGKRQVFVQSAVALFAVGECELRAAAVGDVHKSNDGADNGVITAQRIGPAFGQEAGAVGAPERFVVGMCFDVLRQGAEQDAIAGRHACAVGMRVMDGFMEIAADDLRRPLILEHSEGGGIAEHADTLQVHAANGLGGGVEQELDQVGVFAQGTFGMFAVGDVYPNPGSR